MKNKFKIGDEVVCINRGEGCWYQVGDRLIISSDGFTDPYGNSTVYNIEGQDKHVWIEESHFDVFKTKDNIELWDNRELGCDEKYVAVVPNQTKEMVHSPKHYFVFDGVEAIEIIAKSLTVEEFRGYCFGNLLKYRLRCGKKDDIQQELAKADKYKELFEKYKHFCRSN